MATDNENNGALEKFLSGPTLDPDKLGDPPLRDGEDPLLARDRVEVDDETE